MAALEDGLDLREARRRSMDALDLAPAQHKETMQAARSPSAPLSPQPVAPAAVCACAASSSPPHPRPSYFLGRRPPPSSPSTVPLRPAVSRPSTTGI